MIVFTLDEVITAPSGDFHNGQMECFDIKEEDSESIVEEVINKYKARKEEFKNNEVYVDSCNWFKVDYELSYRTSNGNLERFSLWSDIYEEHECLDTYICKMKHKTTKKMKQQILKFIGESKIDLNN